MPIYSADRTPQTSRFRCLPRTAVLLTALCAGMLGAGASPADGRHLELTPILENQDDVVGLAHAEDDRLFLVSKEGRIWILRNGTRSASPFLDIRSKVLVTGTQAGEQGLLSMAFHPDYARNGYFFVVYTRLDGAGVLARFSVSGTDPDRAVGASERVLLTIPQPGDSHNANHLAFGPDGYLYLSAGDGGYLQEPRCTPQEGDLLLGKILRLDVTSEPDQAPYYRIPSDNPFVGDGSRRSEIWGLGLRNPWRFSFDSETGDLWLSDVGHRRREEINFLAAGSPGGQNWGFKMMEGSECRGNASGCPADVPPCFDPAYTDPVLDYGHDDRHCAVIGGVVYRGAGIPELQGAYLAGDFCGAAFLVRQENGIFLREDLTTDFFRLTTFGEDAAGEVYALVAGTLYRIDGLAEDGTVSMAAAELNVAETAGTARIEVLRQGDAAGDASVSFSVTELSATDGEDFTAQNGILTWADGDGSSRFVDVTILDDGLLEGDERFQVALESPAGAELGSRAVTEVVIVDDERTGVCVPSDTVLCLAEGRFQVSVLWRDFEGQAGVGHAVPLAGTLPDPQGLGSSGLMWFFRSDNAEMLVKILSACNVNGFHWVFLAAATDVGYTVEVLDTQTGTVKSYLNPLGTASPAITDIEAFACP